MGAADAVTKRLVRRLKYLINYAQLEAELTEEMVLHFPYPLVIS
jgi:hypothetical protein